MALIPLRLVAMFAILVGVFGAGFWLVIDDFASWHAEHWAAIADYERLPADCVARPDAVACGGGSWQAQASEYAAEMRSEADQWAEVNRSVARWRGPLGAVAFAFAVALGPIVVVSAVVAAVTLGRLNESRSTGNLVLGGAPERAVLAYGVLGGICAAVVATAAMVVGCLVARSVGMSAEAVAAPVGVGFVARRFAALAALTVLAAVVGAAVGLRGRRILEATFGAMIAAAAIVFGIGATGLIANLAALDVRPNRRAFVWPAAESLDAPMAAPLTWWSVAAVALIVAATLLWWRSRRSIVTPG